MRTVTVWFILVAPIAILLFDVLLYILGGYTATITAVVRSWHEQSSWPEFLFLVGVLLLYSHFFRGFP